ncbi:MAG: hypothetical protein ACYDDF_12255, partial [Thermoplasmatota archaeon]
FGFWQRASNRIHVAASVVATAALIVHSGVGLVDMEQILTGAVPPPPYSDTYFTFGMIVGFSAFLLILTSFVAFTDPKRFERPWDPKVVHAFAYGGFLFATIHAVAIGTDFPAFLFPGIAAAIVLLLYLLIARFRAGRTPMEARHAA